MTTPPNNPPNIPPKETRTFSALVQVVEALRGPNGCPWDKEQTHATLTQYAIEEAHELAEAIDQNNMPGIVEELGDLLLQVVLHAEIGRQSGQFTLEDVIQAITEKMIRRHPHVFGDTKVSGSGDVLTNWSRLKEKERANGGWASSIPVTLPALIRAQKIGDKTVRRGFDWSTATEVLGKIDEELAELRAAIEKKDLENQQEEIGDVLFTVVQVARHLHFDAEQALRMTNRKFENRFRKMFDLIERDGRSREELPLAELEKYWQKAKALEG